MKIGPLEIIFRRRVSVEKKADDFWTRDDLDFGGTLPRSMYAYGRDLRRGLDSNVIMAPVGWIMRTFTESQPIVESVRNDRWKRVSGHRIERLLSNPNPFYDDDALLKALVLSYCLDGNAYAIKRRNAIGEVLELWYAPHWLVEPKWPDDGSVFISHYEYQPGNGAITRIAPRDMIHIRFGLDPRNVRLGLSPLKPLLREVFTDEEASNFAASALRNQGLPGVVLSPKDGTTQTREDATKLKELFTLSFTGDNRGKTFVTTRPTDVSTFGFNAQQLNLTGLRDISEERVCAIIGVPAAVVGFGAGLQQTKVGATMRELVRLARVNAINPMAKSFGKAKTRQLLSDQVARPESFRIRFDMSDVSVFQEDETEREARILARVAAGVMKVSDAQAELGQEVDETQSVYLRETSKTAVRADEDPVVSTPTAPTNGNGINRLESIIAEETGS